CSGTTISTGLQVGTQTYVAHVGCPNTATLTPVIDAGLSDLEPEIFKSDFTPTLNAVELNAIPPMLVNSTIYGVPVTLNVRHALQSLEFSAGSDCNPSNPSCSANAENTACVPDLTTGQLAALYTGFALEWTAIANPYSAGPPFSVADSLSIPDVFLCRRT